MVLHHLQVAKGPHAERDRDRAVGHLKENING
jgi:hypothetical protein